MRVRTLGRTGLVVSEIGLGTVELGLDYGVPVGGEHLRPTEEQAARLLHRALDRGVTLVDTARAYGASEEVIGRALAGRRGEYVLATKLAPLVDEGQPDDVLREAVHASIAASLRALRTDVIDLLLLHRAPVETVRRGRVLAAIREAQAAGEVRFVGASTYGVEEPLAALDDGGYDVLQVAYNLADRSMAEEVLPRAARQGVGIVVRSVLLRGVLTHRAAYLPDALGELRGAVERLAALAEGARCTLPEMAYRFALAHPAVSSALVGTARVEELEAALGYAEQGPLAPALIEAIAGVTVRDTAQLNPATWPDESAWHPRP